MATVPIPSDFEALSRLLDAGDIEQVRDILAGIDAEDESYLVLRIKLSVLDGSLPPGAAMQRLIQLMRREADWPFAKECYQWTSQQAFLQRQSSAALSHIPPPVKNR